MAQYPHLVQIAWQTVTKLVDDWGKNPYFWEREIDVQAELRSRLASLYSVLGVQEVISTEKDTHAADGIFTYRYSRVACEPSVAYKYSDKQTYRAMPDVVVWGDLEDPSVTAEDWPILWACEIKYMGGVKSDWDIEKLGFLIDQNRIKFGCWLTFEWDNSLKTSDCSWDTSTHGARLWTCTARAPNTAGLS